MFKSKEANYYFMMGLDYLGDNEILEIEKMVLETEQIEDSHTQVKLQELFEIVINSVVEGKLTINPIDEIRSVVRNTVNCGFVREWNPKFVRYNEYNLYEEMNRIEESNTGMIVSESVRLENQFLKIEQVYNKYKELTGREKVLAISNKKDTEFTGNTFNSMGATIRDVTYILGENLEEDLEYKENVWYDLDEIVEDYFRESINMENITMDEEITRVKALQYRNDAKNRDYYKLDDIIELYNNSKELSKFSDTLIRLILESIVYMDTMRKECLYLLT